MVNGSQDARNLSPPLPPPVQNHLVHLLPQRFHVGIGKASVQRAHAVRVVADGSFSA